MATFHYGWLRKICHRKSCNERLTVSVLFNMKPGTWVIFLVVVVLSTRARAAENSGDLWWPQFRGPNASGVGGGKPPVHFGPSENVQWKTAVGAVLSSPIIWAERIFLTEFDPVS